jgi:hypothetical protein
VRGNYCRRRVLNCAVGVELDCSSAATLPADLSIELQPITTFKFIISGGRGTPNVLSAPYDPLPILFSVTFIFFCEALTGAPIANKVTIPPF